MPRILIVAATTGYQTRAFAAAAGRLGIDFALATDRCHVLENPWGDRAIPVRFDDPVTAAKTLARAGPFDGVVAAGDRPAFLAALAAKESGFRFHSPASVEAAGDKYLTRRRFEAAGLPVPRFFRVSLDSDPPRGREPSGCGAPGTGGTTGSVVAPDAASQSTFYEEKTASEPHPGSGGQTLRETLEAAAEQAMYPCVLKPLGLSASRGVIRADTQAQFEAAFRRIGALLRRPEIQVLREDRNRFIQVESFIEGREFALEGLMTAGRLKTLAVFEKPDPLDGPFFEETIYLTPPRTPAGELVPSIKLAVERAVRALGLSHGPIHAELRHDGVTAWVLEVAARPIGGLCAGSLRFDPDGLSLEELLVMHAAGQDVSGLERERCASGVMMIPIPHAGIYEGVDGLEALDERRDRGETGPAA